MSNFAEYMEYFESVMAILANDSRYQEKYEDIIKTLISCRERQGRVFIVGMGGSAANAQHMANDFRKIAGLDAISLSDNIAELTARANDDGLDTIYINTLQVSNFDWKDVLFVLSVSGGNEEINASIALVKAVRYAKEKGGLVLGIVGMPHSATHTWGDFVIVTPQSTKYLTGIAETLQGLLWHGIVNDPRLVMNKAKW